LSEVSSIASCAYREDRRSSAGYVPRGFTA
jgi:hypothetical protein